MASVISKISTSFLTSGLLMLFCLFPGLSDAVTKISITSGNFSNASIWSPVGVPVAGDSVIISTNTKVTLDVHAQTGGVLVAPGAELIVTGGKSLNIGGAITINGTVDVNEGDLLLAASATFKMGSVGKLFWDPYTNTAAGTSLFLSGIEQFHPSSSLIIKKWYSYSNVPIGKVVTGNFGNLSLSTLTNGLIFEWDQQNYFEAHEIKGTLTIDQGWVVLDKSGSISNTQIGSIELKNINSYLDFHYGDHHGDFLVRTGSIFNTGGVIHGLINGNGNIELEVTGDFTNLGTVALIKNAGIQGKGNGNAKLNVGGLFRQTHGDFRGIFNITTLNSGVADLEFENMKLEGGIFMGQYNCHVNGGISKLKINGDLITNFQQATNLFRGAGLTTLSGRSSNLRLEMIIGGDLMIAGHSDAEFTSSASNGKETVTISGNTLVEGSVVSFNYGNHQTELYFGQDLSLTGGVIHLSKTSGTLLAEIGADLVVTGGTLSIRNQSGHTNLNIRGGYDQQGGTVFLYNNTSQPAEHTVYVTVSGDFSVQKGKIWFTNMPLSSAQHHLSLNGKVIMLGDSAEISQPVTTQKTGYGIIHYDRTGEMEYINGGNGVVIRNIIQSVSNGCTLSVKNGNLISSSGMHSGHPMFEINSGGVVDLGNRQIINPVAQTFSRLIIEDDGRIRISSAKGLYDGTVQATISSANQMSFAFDPSGIAEYYGSQDQVITGTGVGLAQGTEQQYGILEINKPAGKATAASNQVHIRTTLFLNEGELDLNGYNITIHNGKTHGITREKGYIRSEHPRHEEQGQVVWEKTEFGLHSIPFGISENEVFPLNFVIRTGAGRSFIASTRSCEKDNKPYPQGVTTLPGTEENTGAQNIIDRWYYIQANGIRADITLSYLGSENTVANDLATDKFSVVNHSQGSWFIAGGADHGVVNGSGSVEAFAVHQWGHFLLASTKTGGGSLNPGNGQGSGNTANISSLLVNPNPFVNSLNVSFNMNKAAPVTISVITANGREVKRILTDGHAGENKVNILLDKATSAGIYILTVTDGISSAQKKIVKHES